VNDHPPSLFVAVSSFSSVLSVCIVCIVCLRRRYSHDSPHPGELGVLCVLVSVFVSMLVCICYLSDVCVCGDSQSSFLNPGWSEMIPTPLINLYEP
jgi:hypothetical protein